MNVIDKIIFLIDEIVILYTLNNTKRREHKIVNERA